jgi:hypothetical protein
MGVELGGQLRVLVTGDVATSPRNGFRRQLPGRRALPEVAIEGADADAEHARGLTFTDASIHRLQQMGAEIEGVGTHEITLLSPSMVSPSQRICKWL